MTKHLLYTQTIQNNTYTHLYGRQKVRETGAQVNLVTTHVFYTQTTKKQHIHKYTHLYGRQKVGETGAQVSVVKMCVLYKQTKQHTQIHIPVWMAKGGGDWSAGKCSDDACAQGREPPWWDTAQRR